MAKALGSVFELSIRYLLLLHASGKDPLTESRLCAEDFICTYAADFGIAAENLNGNSGYRYGEYASRCSMANDAIRHASEVDTPENRKLKKARREAIIAYIDESVKHLGEKIVAMEEEQAAASIPNLDEATASVQAEIDSVQREIDTAITESRSLMEKIYAGNSKISEYDTIRSRFESLQSQYTSDMERLAFIADAEAAGTDVPTPHQCPFCNAEIAIDNAEPLFTATLQELTHIKSHLAELRIASSDIDANGMSL